MPNIGMTEMTLIAVVLLVFFGANRIPEAARSLGRSLNEFKKGVREGSEDKPDA